MLFPHVEEFHDIRDAVYFYMQSALGKFSFEQFLVRRPGLDPEDEKLDVLTYEAGHIFMFLFLVLNLVLLLSFLIAILSHVYSDNVDLEAGLHRHLLLDEIPYLDIDDSRGCKTHGVIPMAHYPLRFLLYPFYIPVVFINSEPIMIKYNSILCKIIYLPQATAVALVFTALNMVLAPFAYLSTLFALVGRLFDRRGDFCSKLFDIFEFAVSGVLFIVLSLFIDPVRFLVNLANEEKAEFVESFKVSMQSLNTFEIVCNEVIEESKAEQGAGGGGSGDGGLVLYDFIKFNKRLEKKFQLHRAM